MLVEVEELVELLEELDFVEEDFEPNRLFHAVALSLLVPPIMKS